MSEDTSARWSRERIDDWYARQPWIVGFNYLPRTAVNWTELWQAETFDLGTIEQELDWARELGFNALRTNLQYLVWKHDPAGLRARLDRFLGAAAARGMRTLLCPFDDCAFSGLEPYLGPQHQPLPGLHNSGAAASPGREVVRARAHWPDLERYVRDVVGHFRDDARLLAWDLYNEPGNQGVISRPVERHPEGPLWPHSMALAEACFDWARAAAPTQPLTSGVWSPRWRERELRLVELSDFTSFHHYLALPALSNHVDELRAFDRPLVCTEWLARSLGSLPSAVLPYFAKERIGCFHWGLVQGRTQTHLPWPGIPHPDPALWHHDLLHPDGTPFDVAEIALFRAACSTART